MANSNYSMNLSKIELVIVQDRYGLHQADWECLIYNLLNYIFENTSAIMRKDYQSSSTIIIPEVAKIDLLGKYFTSNLEKVWY